MTRERFPISVEELHAVLAPFAVARPLPPVAYHHQAVFDHERAVVFGRSWLVVGREEDVTAPGQWVRAPLSTEGILVVRGADLELRAFRNVCRHRGTTLVEGACGALHEIRCPYHGWTYELSGALRAAPHTRDGFDRAAHGLTPVRVDVWQGFVFVTQLDGAPPLHEALGDVPPWLSETPLTQVRRAHASEYETRANWKLIVQNFQESDHFRRVHPALDRLTPNERASSVLGDGPWLGGTMAFAEGVETVSTSSKRSGRPFVAPPPYRHVVHDAMLFPLLLTSLQPDYFLTYRLQPLAPDRTHVVAEIFVHPGAMKPSEPSIPTFPPRDGGEGAGTGTLEAHRGALFDDVVSFWEVVNAEDRAICERQQVGTGSRGYVPSAYSTVEDGVHAFDRLVAKAYLA